MTDYPISNSEFVDGLLDAVEAGPAGTAALTAEQSRTNLLQVLEEWSGGSILPANIARKLTSSLASWDQFTNGMWQLLTVGPTGGPNNNGIVILVDHLGNEYPVYSYQKLAADMHKGDPGSTHADLEWGYVGPPPSGDESSPPRRASTPITLTEADCVIAVRDVSPTNDYTVRVWSNEGGTAHIIGTITVLAGQVTSTADFSDLNFPYGTIYWIQHPSAADPTFTNFTVILSGERQL